MSLSPSRFLASAAPRVLAAASASLVLAFAAAAGAGDPARLVLGAPLDLELDAAGSIDTDGLACARALQFLPAESAAYTILVGSSDADVLVRRVDATGATLAEDDDGGIEWNARLVVLATAGEPLRLVAGFKSARAGRLRVEVLLGEAPEPEGAELALARADFLRDRGHARLARGEKLKAAFDLHGAGEIEFAIGQHARALTTYREVLELAEELDHRLIRTVAQAVLGTVHLSFQELEDARAALDDAIVGARALKHGPLELFARGKRGELHIQTGEPDTARAQFEQALELAVALGDRASEIGLCSLTARAWSLEGGDAQAGEWHARALRSARALGQPKPLALALLNAGRFHEERRALSEARAALEEALRIDDGAPLRAALRGLLGNVAVHSGDPLTAADHYATALSEARMLGNKGLEAAALLGLGLAEEMLGNLDGARARLEQSLELLGDEAAPAERGEALRTLASVRIEQGEIEAARPLLDEALVLAERAASVRMEVRVHASLVQWHYRRGEYRAAIEPARRLLDLGRENDLPDAEAVGMDHVAELELRAGNLERARPLAEEAVERCRALGDARLLQSALLTLVECVQRLGDLEAMAAAVTEAESCFERIDAARLDPERLSLLRAHEVFALWGEYTQELVAARLAAADADPDARRALIEDGFRRAGLWKSRGLLLGIAEHRSGRRDAATIGLWRSRRASLAEHEAVLTAIASAQRGGSDAAAELQAGRDRLGEIEARIAQLEEALRARAPRAAALDAPNGAHPRDLAHVLGPSDLLIEYANGRQRLFAYSLARGELRFHDLGAREDVEERVAQFRDEIARPPTASAPQRIARLGHSLYAGLLRPVLAAVEPGVGCLVLSPTPALAALPFSALVVEAPESARGFAELTFVLDRHAVVTTPSAPVLALSDASRSGARAALVVGDPVFTGESPAGPAGAARRAWPRLPATRGEALLVAAAIGSALTREPIDARHEALRSKIGSARSATLRHDGVQLHLGADATPARFAGDLREFAILHCATHGWIDPRDPRRSGLVLAAGLDGDELLGTDEILDLDLDADLVVLSACDTGRGAVLRGEGVQSLARAFQFAGARAVVATLWPVGDDATGDVMQAFYARLAGTRVVLAEALRQACLDVRRGGVDGSLLRGVDAGGAGAGVPLGAGHPRVWAPFVLSGTPRAQAGISSE